MRPDRLLVVPALLAALAGSSACTSVALRPAAPAPALPPAEGGTPAGSVDVVLGGRFSGEAVRVTLDGQLLRSGPLAQPWRERRAVSPDSHVVAIEVNGLDGRRFTSSRRILPAEWRCVWAHFDPAPSAFPRNLRVETRAAC